MLFTLFVTALLSTLSATALADSAAPPASVQAVLSKYCADCHADGADEGGVQLDTVSSLGKDARLELLNKAQEQLFFKMMPPEGEDQPTVAEGKLLAEWVGGVLQDASASKLEEKLRYPDYANYLDHEKLFSGENEQPAYSPARRWLISPQIFDERVIDVFRVEGHDRDRNKGRLFGVTNPFMLPEHSGVRYYDITTLDGGHLLVMLGNAEWISSKQILAARIKQGKFKAGDIENPKDRWYPRQTPAAFEEIILSNTAPTDDQLIAAIHAQFECVLRRQASDSEIEKYLPLTQAAIELGGNTEGLRQMLKTVLLESEFLYRLEFGAGEVDRHGRKKLSPREASYAISYALGDRGPDAALVEAAEEGRLNTKEDYKREVLRLLADENYYHGQIDRTLDGKHFRSHATSHPRIVQFFRDFFGYPGALKVFKDNIRSGGYYINPSRGTTASPGWLINEADNIVMWYVERDDNLFENLLTTEEFFVYHNMDNETGLQYIAEWKHVYETLKDTEWKTNPDKVLAENLEFLKSAKTLRINRVEQKTEFLRYMHYFKDTFGKGGSPFPRGPWTHGFTYNHSPSYNLPRLPYRGRYERINTDRFKELDETKFWDYPVVQPFKIEHRKGILTHPAWLIAHSQNSETDPVIRGRWVREKLLAGYVPDVPITVDAQIPADPHHTLRERLEAVTGKQACWKCHQHMNPLGIPFEIYDDFGRFRTEENLEHPDNIIGKSKEHNGGHFYKTKPVNATGELTGTGDPELDGEVQDALGMIDRLAKSKRARQSIIRHAFRFYMGRNEMLSDSRTLIDADQAYVNSGGSFKAVIVSLLTSDSFMYRK